MSTPPSPTQLDAAWAYQALFVPALFAPWAPRVAHAARVGPGDRVLDVACGTGILAREVHVRTGPGGNVVGLDPNPGMLAVARELAPSIDWRSGVAEAIPFPDQSFDAVVSQFGLMFFGDRGRALQEMQRVLAPGGRLAVAVWDRLEEMPAYAAEVALVERIAGTPAADALRAPFVLGLRERLAALFDDAGATSITVATATGFARFPSIRVMVEADLRGWLPVMGVILSEEQVEHILRTAERALAEHVQPDGSVSFRVSAHLVVTEKA